MKSIINGRARVSHRSFFLIVLAIFSPIYGFGQTGSENSPLIGRVRLAKPVVLEVVEPLLEVKEIKNVKRNSEDKPKSNAKKGPKPSLTIDEYILESCRRYKIDPRLIQAQMKQESSFKLRATSDKGARGLMQLMPATAARFGVTDIYDPQQNIDAGVKYMRWLLDTFGDVRLALAGYNAGEGAVMKYGNRIPPYRETIQYVERIGHTYYGQAGHGTLFAWNYEAAVRYTNALYPGGDSSRRNNALIDTEKIYSESAGKTKTPARGDNTDSDNGKSANRQKISPSESAAPVEPSPPRRVLSLSLYLKPAK